MKKTVLLLLTIFAIASAAMAQTKTSSKGGPDKKNKGVPDTYIMPDFRDIKWGTHLDSVFRDDVKINFVKSTEYGNKNAYYIADDDMTIGTVTLKSLYYIFNDKNRFIGVVLMGESRFLGEMKYILVNKFGQPESTEEGAANKQYFWNVDDVRVSLTNEGISQVFTAEFTSDYDISESKRINRNVDDF